MYSSNLTSTQSMIDEIYLITNNTLSSLVFGSDLGKSSIPTVELEILRTLSRIFSSFSILGLIFVQLVFWFFPTIRTFAFELVAWLSFSNIFFNISNFLPVDDNIDNQSWSCSVQAGLNIYFDLSSMIWTTIIGYTAFTSVTMQDSLDSNKMKYRLSFIFCAYILPLIYTLIVFNNDAFGHSGVFCWIQTENGNPLNENLIIIYYSLTWFIIFLNCIFVIKVIVQLHKELKNEQDLIDKYTNKLKWYPIVQIISYIPCTIRRIYGLYSPNDNFWILLFQGIFDSLTGLMFALVYGMNVSVKNTVHEFLLKFLGRKKVNLRKESSISEDMEGNLTDIPNRLSRSLTYLDESFNEN